MKGVASIDTCRPEEEHPGLVARLRSDRRINAMPLLNEHLFRGSAANGTYLEARGFSPSGTRSGGIVDPKLVTIAQDALLFRFFHDPTYQFGGWWSTPCEQARVAEHFAREGAAFDAGRPEGKGILHASFAIRHDWANGDPDQLGRFMLVRLREPLLAYHGEGDVAPDPTQTQVQKPALILANGRQRAPRHVFLPRCGTYLGGFDVVTAGHTATGFLARLSSTPTAPLPFEIP
jgi:hypothetical protein